jgi:hypothetical protein
VERCHLRMGSLMTATISQLFPICPNNLSLDYLAEPCQPNSRRRKPKPAVANLSRADRISLGTEFQSTLTSFLCSFCFRLAVLMTIEPTTTTSIGKYFISLDDTVCLGLLWHNFSALERISLRDCLVKWEPRPLPSRSLRFKEVIRGKHGMGRRDPVGFYTSKALLSFFGAR